MGSLKSLYSNKSSFWVLKYCLFYVGLSIKKIEFIEFIVEFHLKRGELYF